MTQIISHILGVLTILEAFFSVHRFCILWTVPLHILRLASSVRIQVRRFTILSVIGDFNTWWRNLLSLRQVSRRHYEIVCKRLNRIRVLYYLITIVNREALYVIVNYIWKLSIWSSCYDWLSNTRWREGSVIDLAHPRILGHCFDRQSLHCLMVSTMLRGKFSLAYHLTRGARSAIIWINCCELSLQTYAIYYWIRHKFLSLLPSARRSALFSWY